MPLCQPTLTTGGQTWWITLQQDAHFALQKHKTGPPLRQAPPLRILLRGSHSFLVAETDDEKRLYQEWDLLRLLLIHFQDTKAKLCSATRREEGEDGDDEEAQHERRGEASEYQEERKDELLKDFAAFLMDQHYALKKLVNPTTNSYVLTEVQKVVELAVADDFGSSLPPSSSPSFSDASSPSSSSPSSFLVPSLSTSFSVTSSDGSISQRESLQSEDDFSSSSTPTTPRTLFEEQLRHNSQEDLFDSDQEMKETWALDPSDIKEFRELFKLPSDEPFIDYFECVLKNGFGTSNFQGHLYVWQHYVCFAPKNYSRSKKKKLVLCFVDILMMRKHSSLRITDAIEIRLSNEHYSFFSFVSRDPCFSILEYLWKLRHETEPIVISGKPIAQMLGHVKYPKESGAFKQLFAEVWSPDDSFVEHFSCSYHGDVLKLKGRLYVTQNYICFQSETVFISKHLKVVIPIANALGVKKQHTSFIFSNALELTTPEGNYVFSGFLSWDKAFRVISFLLERAKYNKEHYIPRVMVIGGSTAIGVALIRLLVQHVKVRAIVRSKQRKAELESIGAEVVQLDLDDASPDPLLVQRAFSDVDRIFFKQGVTPNVLEQTQFIITEALKAGVSHIAKVSPLGSKNGTGSVASLHLAAERQIEASGIPFTVLRLNAYMQNLIDHFSSAEGTIYFPVGQAKIAWLDTRDVAACAAHILCHPDISKYNRAIYELTGPCAITCDRVAQLLSAALKRSIKVYDAETAEAARGPLPMLVGRSDWLVSTMMELYEYFRQGNGEYLTTHVFDILGRAPHTVEEFIEAHRREFLTDRKNYFDHSEIEVLHSQFSRLDKNSDGFVDLQDFYKGMGGVLSQCPPLVEGLFRAFDTTHEKKIDFSQFLHGMSILMKGNLTERLEFAFRTFDKEAKGKITWPDMEPLFRSIATLLYQYGLLDIPGLPPRGRDVQVVQREPTGEEDEERLREEEEAEDEVHESAGLAKSLAIGKATQTNETGEPEAEDANQQEKEKEGETDDIMKFGRELFGKLCAFQVKLHSLPRRSRSSSRLRRFSSSVEIDTVGNETEANQKNVLKEKLGITMNTWKEFFAQKDELRNVQALGGLLEATATSPTFFHSMHSHSSDEMKQKATINPGHSSWDFVVYMLVGIRKAQESSFLSSSALLNNTSKEQNSITPSSSPKDYINSTSLTSSDEHNAYGDNMVKDLPREAFKTEVRHDLSPSAEYLTIFASSSSSIFASDFTSAGSSSPSSSPPPLPSSSFSSSSSKWSFKDYAPLVFRRLRALFGVSEEEFKLVLGPERVIGNLLLGNVSALDEVVNTGRSGSFLYKSLAGGGRFFIKTLPPEECLFFRRILPSYYTYMMDNPNSLLIRFLGLYKMHKPRHTVYFVVMENALFTDLPINEQYDLKGSTVNRTVLKSEQDVIDPSIAMKDNDFHRKLKLPPSCKELFVQQIKRDCKWLESHAVCDYSLLVGIHVSQSTVEQEQRRFTRASLNREANRSLPLLQRYRVPHYHPSHQKRLSSGTPATFSLFRKDHGGIRAAGAAANELYFFGLIDILTVYNLKKRSEHTFKAILYDSTQISAIPPTPYRKRFIKYIRSIVE
ncbi:Phosphatidylinositol phosphate kinase 6 [Balamuthia mandrillaris]